MAMAMHTELCNKDHFFFFVQEIEVFSDLARLQEVEEAKRKVLQ